jgi:hypothetical protein
MTTTVAPNLKPDPTDSDTRTPLLRREFQPTGVYLDFAPYGLQPKVALGARSAVTAASASGRSDPVSCDRAGVRTRSTFAGLHDFFAEDVAIGHRSGLKTFRLADHASGGAPCRSVS